MSDFKLTTPVAFLLFNRPETTARVFAEIARGKPPKLLVVADGPRANRPGEAELCAAARAVIEKVDWDCEVVTHFSEVNLGCKRRMSSGVDWVFQTVPEAILLEDDCLPHPSFFRFCEEMLEGYRNDERISMIGGTNFQKGRERSPDSYYFSRYTHIWGWASWRRAWQKIYDVEMRAWPEFREAGGLEKLFGSRRAAVFWKNIFDKVHAGEVDTWDYQLVFGNFLHGTFAATPEVNLISNIGFGADATHTRDTDDSEANMPVAAMRFPLRHAVAVVHNAEADAYEQKTCFDHGIAKRIAYKLKSLIRALSP